jgi:hypothetical protein
MQIWKTKQVTHEGFPLFLRYPEQLDFGTLRVAFPNLAVITHHLSMVRPNGLPDADYNDKLFRFDMDVRAAFEAPSVGVTTLIETFAGKRNYYIYVGKGTDVANYLSSLARLHPDEKLTWTVRADPEWSFIKRYSAEYLSI